MNGDRIADFIDMGGYALYVWGSYGFCALALAWEALILLHRRRRATDEVREWRAIDDQSQRPRGDDPGPSIPESD